TFDTRNSGHPNIHQNDARVGTGNFAERLLTTRIGTHAAITPGLFQNSLEKKPRFSVAIYNGDFNRFLPCPEKVAELVFLESLDAAKTPGSLRGTLKSQALVRVLIVERASGCTARFGVRTQRRRRYPAEQPLPVGFDFRKRNG